MAAATTSQAWAILARHARDEIAPLRLQELCHDADRVSSLVAVHTVSDAAAARGAAPKEDRHRDGERILLADLSRQRMTLETMNHLLRLAGASDVRGYVRTLAWGQNDRDDPVVPLRLRRQQQDRRGPGGKVDGGQQQQPPPQQQHRSRHARFAADDGDGGEGGGVAGDRPDPLRTSPSMHLALRAPSGQGLEMLTADGANALDDIHQEWGRIERLSDSIRRGQLPGATGSILRDVVVVGRGVPIAALQFMYEALRRDEEAAKAAVAPLASGGRGGGKSTAHRQQRPRRMRFVTSVDPNAAAAVVADLDPESTVVVSFAPRGDEETGLATRILKGWLLQGLGSHRRPDLVVNKHMLLVTGNERLKLARPESVFLMPGHSRCEAFTTFTAAGLLPLAIVFGWKVVNEILSGAHDLDTHFVETNPRHNLPILLALTDVWNDAFLSLSGRVMSPFTEAFSAYPTFVAALEAQTCGRGNADVTSRQVTSAIVIDGGMSGMYDRSLYQSGKAAPSELITAMDTQASWSANAARTMGVDGLEDLLANQDAQICSFFAHADVLAVGSSGRGEDADAAGGIGHRTYGPLSPISAQPPSSNEDHAEGNRPSTLLICGRCDAFTCGQLVALAEHRAVVKAKLWGVDPFARTVGASIRAERTEIMKEKLQEMYERIAMGRNLDDDGDGGPSSGAGSQINLATSTILGHYANRTQDQKMYVVKR